MPSNRSKYGDNGGMAEELRTLARLLADTTLVVVAIVYGLLLTLTAAAGYLFGLWLGILVLLSLGRFGYAVLRVAAQGRDAKAPDIETMNPISELPLVAHLVIFPGLIFWYLVVVTLNDDSITGLAYLLITLSLVMFPASAALMGMTHNFMYSVNPMRIIRVIQGLGRRYFILLLACLGVFFASQLVLSLLALSWGLVYQIVSMSIGVWTYLILFGLIGVTVYSAREVFDIPGLAEVADDRQTRWDQEDKYAEWRRALDIIYGNWRSEQHAQAYAELRELIDGEPGPAAILPWLFENILAWEDKHCALSIGRLLVRQLIADDQVAQAMTIVLRCRRYADVLVLAPGDAALLAGRARGIGQLGLADELASWENQSK
jgi:hypothetical protein